jgi:hypothetical protein
MKKGMLKQALQWLWLFIKKHWRWLLPVLFFAIWYFFLDKHYVDFIAGIVFMGGFWWAWNHFIAGRK